MPASHPSFHILLTVLSLFALSPLTGQKGQGIHPGRDNDDMQISGITLTQTSSPAGRGAIDEPLLCINVQTRGANNSVVLNTIRITLDGTTDSTDIRTLKLYSTGDRPRFRPDSLLATALPQAGSLPVNRSLQEGDNYFWLTADLTQDAQEGNFLDAACTQLRLNGAVIVVDTANPEGRRTILLENRLLFAGGDYGSASYRIPALVTAADGALVAAADARINGPGDLPGDIDIVVRRSTDMGKTWSTPVVVADFGVQGASDPALVLDRNSGDLLCLFASHQGLFQSTPSDKIRFQVSRSTDNGISWSAPRECSAGIYAPGWHAAWVASGSAHQLRDGRIVAAAGVRQNSTHTISNFMVYSDDGGESWHYAPSAAAATGNEAKIAELDDGSLMMNIRNPGFRKITVSTDGGRQWSPALLQNDLMDPFVNGDLIRYTSVRDGFDKSRLLFSIARHPTLRQNLSVMLSYDEGKSWPVHKTIYAGPSAYSALAILPDGSIGCFYEHGEYETYQLYFVRFSLDWLTNGSDRFSPASD